VLRGRALPDGRRVELDPVSFTLRVGAAAFLLDGKTLDDGLAWLSTELSTQPGQPMKPLQHELPSRPLEQPFERHGAEAQLMAWFQLAQRLLSPLAASKSGGEVRLWPHHFDIATLIELDSGGRETGGGRDNARSINVGLSPGDAAYPEPYWYVTPWPPPGGALPELARGHWHREGFTAAVLPASAHDATRVADEAATFLEGAFDACSEVLRR
jgi:hypothetical protein